MQVSVVDEPSEVLILEEDTEDVNRDEFLPELPESNTMTTAENDVIVLEESAVIPTAPVLTTEAPEAGSECLS